MKIKYLKTGVFKDGQGWFFRKRGEKFISLCTYNNMYQLSLDGLANYAFDSNNSDNYEPCTEAEFNAAFELVKAKINSIKL